MSSLGPTGSSRWAWVGLVALCTVLGGPVATADDGIVAARVNGQPIYTAEVQQVVSGAIGGREVQPQAEAVILAQALEQAINRQLLKGMLAEKNITASDQEIAEAEAQLAARLGAQNASIDQLLMQRGLSREAFHKQLEWEVAWKKYLEQQTNDAALEQFFEENRRQFDGTELRCGHILLRSDGPSTPQSVQAMMQQALEIRQQIVDGQLTFAEAAEKYSVGPSRHDGGDLGFITRQGQMVEAFSKAAFELEPGEVSQPVVTPFGIHLIQCGEERPGRLIWQDVRTLLEPAYVQHLFTATAARLREGAEIEYTGALPHVDPDTGRLVMGGAGGS